MTNKIRKDIATNFPHQIYFFFKLSLIQELSTCVRSWKHLSASISFQLHVRYFRNSKCILWMYKLYDNNRRCKLRIIFKRRTLCCIELNMKYKWCIHKTKKASEHLYYFSVSFEYLTIFVKTWLFLTFFRMKIKYWSLLSYNALW